MLFIKHTPLLKQKKKKCLRPKQSALNYFFFVRVFFFDTSFALSLSFSLSNIFYIVSETWNTKVKSRNVLVIRHSSQMTTCRSSAAAFVIRAGGLRHAPTVYYTSRQVLESTGNHYRGYVHYEGTRDQQHFLNIWSFKFFFFLKKKKERKTKIHTHWCGMDKHHRQEEHHISLSL